MAKTINDARKQRTTYQITQGVTLYLRPGACYLSIRSHHIPVSCDRIEWGIAIQALYGNMIDGRTQRAIVQAVREFHNPVTSKK